MVGSLSTRMSGGEESRPAPVFRSTHLAAGPFMTVKHAFWLLVVFGFGLFGLSLTSLCASSVIETELASVKELRLVISTGGLGYDPLPHLDRNALDEKLKDELKTLLERASIRVVPEAPLTLFISAEHQAEPRAPGWVAIGVRVWLSEPVETQRPIIWLANSPFTGDTWQWGTVDLVEEATVEAEILEWSSIGVETFAGSVVQARDYVASREATENPD